jgi:type VI protein secretion system component VasF
VPDLTEDELHESFARFRAEFQEELRPPGTQAIRRRVARRRRARTAVATCGVILALLGGFAAYARTMGIQRTASM